jgi:hypothetical protein
MATTRIDDPKPPPTDRCAIASPTGGGTEALELEIKDRWYGWY